MNEVKKIHHRGTGIGVKIKEGQNRDEKKINLEIALKRFKKRQKEFGVLFEIRERQEFTKPSAKRRKLIQQAISRNDREVAFEKEMEKLSNI